jgi:hypothetical protein
MESQRTIWVVQDWHCREAPGVVDVIGSIRKSVNVLPSI